MSTKNIFRISPDDFTEVIIDGANFFYAARDVDIQFDWKLLHEHAEQMAGNRCRLSYFAALPPKDVENPVRRLTDWLAFNGYTTHIKETQNYTDNDGNTRFKGDVDVDVAIHMLEIAYNRGVDHIILFSGDGDYVPAIEAVKRRGIKVTAVSSKAMMSEKLRRAADNTVFINDDTFINAFEKVED
tara:strand:+ start:362 stop:916 length:555 start_codon:yes stop_codon:yes gene_type:complete